MQNSFRASYRLPLLAVFVYTIYALILLHPLWVYNGTHHAGYDYFNYQWNFWWIRHAWANGLDIYHNQYVMFPALSNYGYHALTPVWYPVWAMLEPLLGTLTAVNVMITLGCILNGYVLFLWLRSIGAAAGLALLGGLMLQTLPITRYWYYNTHLNLMDWFWLPLLLLTWARIEAAASGSGRRLGRLALWAVALGVMLYALLLTDLQFPIFAAFVVVPYGLLTLATALRQRRLLALGKMIGAGLLAVTLGALLMWFAGPLRAIAQFEGTFLPGPVEDRPGIPFPMGFLSMAERWWSWDAPSLGAFFPLLLLLSVAIALWRRKVSSRAWFWLVVAVPPLVLAMGPHLSIGETRVPLPFVWMYELTNGNFRMPWRLAPAGVIAGSAFIALVWTHWRPRGSMALGVAALLLSGLAVRLFETGPIEPVLPQYETYEAMGREPYDYVVLQAPTGMGTGEVLLGNPRAIQYQWYGITHEKPMINGFISRAPIEDFYYVETDDPLLSWLGQRRLLEPDVAASLLLERVFNYPLGYVVVHTDDVARASVPAVVEIIGFLNAQPEALCPPLVEGAAVFYRTRWHPDGCEPRTPSTTDDGYLIDIGAQDDFRYLGWGWHEAEPVGGVTWRWMGSAPMLAALPDERDSGMASLYLDVPPGAYALTIAGQSFVEERLMAVEVNGQRLDGLLSFPTDRLAELSIQIPASVIGSGQQVEIRLFAPQPVSAAELGLGTDTRPLSIAVDYVRMTARP